MKLWDDERAAAIQIGAVILFGFLILTLAIYQATVVPQENSRIEYEHSLRAQDDMQNVRNSIVSASGGGTASSVGVNLAPQYPTRALFVNPGPPSGTVRTVGTGDPRINLTVNNATVPGSEADDFWDGSAKTYNTGGLVYEPNYNVYTGAPVTVYENTVLYNQEDDGPAITKAGQNLVDGRTISLVTLNGSLDRTESGTLTVDPKKLSASRTSVTLENTGGNVTISFASRLNATWWTDRLSDELLANGGNVVDVRSTPLSGGFYNVTLELAGDETYTLQMAKVGVGSGTSNPSATYATDVAGNGTSVPEGGTQQVVVEVRDEYNNPVSGVTVEANASLGSLQDTTVTTNKDGEAVFTYEAPNNVNGGQKTVDLNATFATGVDPANGGFDGTAPENVSMTLYVQNSDGSGLGGGGGGGDGAYSIDWQNPDNSDPENTEETLSDCSATDCTWNVSASGDDQLDLRAVTSPTIDGLTAEFAVNDTSIATVSPSSAPTNSAGEVETTLTAKQNGTVKVFVVTGDSSDVINVTLTGVGLDAPSISNPTLTDDTDGDGVVNDGDTVTVSAKVTDDSNVSSVEADVSDFGGSSTLTLTDGDGDDVYDATFTVDESAASSDGDYSATITAEDDEGNTASATTNTLTLDTTPPSLTNPTLTDETDGDGTVSDGDTVRVSVEASDATTISSVTANISDFGGPSSLSLTDGDDDGVYDATFTVDGANSSGSGDYPVEITATDTTGNSGTGTTNSLTLDSGGPAIQNPTITDATDGDGNVTTGDTVEVSAEVTDSDGVSSVTADATDFGGPSSVTLSDPDDDGVYTGSFTVESQSNASEGDQNVTITATDSTGQMSTADTNSLTVDTEPPVFTSVSITDATDGDGNVTTGDTVRVTADVSDPGTGVDAVTADASAFGAGTVTLTDGDGDGVYDTTFQVGSESSATEGDQSVTVTATDYIGQSSQATTGTLTVDTSSPTVSSVTVTDLDDGNGVVGDGDQVTISADVSDAVTGVDTVTADASDFGAGTVTLTDGNNDGTYTATFTVDAANAASDGSYTIPVTGTDYVDLSKTASSGQLTLDTTAPEFTQLVVSTSQQGQGSSGKVTDVTFDYEVTDNLAVQNVTFVVLDSNGNVLDSTTVTSTSGTVTLNAGGTNDVTIRAIVRDQDVNTETCERTNVNGANTFTEDDFTCTKST